MVQVNVTTPETVLPAAGLVMLTGVVFRAGVGVAVGAGVGVAVDVPTL